MSSPSHMEVEGTHWLPLFATALAILDSRCCCDLHVEWSFCWCQFWKDLFCLDIGRWRVNPCHPPPRPPTQKKADFLLHLRNISLGVNRPLIRDKHLELLPDYDFKIKHFPYAMVSHLSKNTYLLWHPRISASPVIIILSRRLLRAVDLRNEAPHAEFLPEGCGVPNKGHN